MSRYVLSPRARADLDDIWAYSAQRWGTDQAKDYIRPGAERDRDGRGRAS
jgi:toxin ParE1/3/4